MHRGVELKPCQDINAYEDTHTVLYTLLFTLIRVLSKYNRNSYIQLSSFHNGASLL